MYITAVEAFFILFATMIGIYIIYKSRMSLLATQALVESTKLRSQLSLDRLSAGLQPLINTRIEYEKFIEQQKSAVKIMCQIDTHKECDLCGQGGELCPFGNGGDAT